MNTVRLRHPACVAFHSVTAQSSSAASCRALIATPECPGTAGSEVTLDVSVVRSLDALARTMAARDASTHRHAQRVQHYAVTLARENQLHDPRMLDAIHVAALLHDIGKLGIPDRLLRKPGPLTRDEYDIVKQHAVLGADILAGLGCTGPLATIVRHHHENWDGSGYPDGLRGDRIPAGARVLAIVDCYDALTSERPYRRQLSHDEAVSMIGERRGTMYDPLLVDVFLRTVSAMAAHPNAHAASPPADESSGRPTLRRNALWMREALAP